MKQKTLLLLTAFMLIFCMIGCSKNYSDLKSNEEFTSLGTTKAAFGTKQFGTSKRNVPTGMTKDSYGNLYIVGNMIGASPVDMFVAKFNSAGSQLWIQKLTTHTTEQAMSITCDSLGDVYITGYTNGNLDGNINQEFSDVFVVKYNSSGVKQWTRTFGSTGRVESYGIAADGYGDIYVTGITTGSLDGNKNIGCVDVFVVKYNSSGVKQWTRTFGSTGVTRVYGIAVDWLGNVYITGNTNGNLDGNVNVGYDDIFLVKYNSYGDKKWTRTIGSMQNEYAYGIAVDRLGNIYITGEVEGPKRLIISVKQDIFLAKYNSAGVKQWHTILGTTGSDGALGIAVDTTDNIYLTGYTTGKLDGKMNKGKQDAFLVKYNSSGVKQWTQLIGTPEDDRGIAITTYLTDIYITGHTSGNISGTGKLGDVDIFLVKYNSSGVQQ